MQTRMRPPLQQQRQVIGSPNPSPTPSRSNSREPLYRTTALETRSRSPSPHLTPTPVTQHEYYGSTNLTDRSRSPSPTSSAPPRRTARRLPATPQKPSTLNLAKRKDDMPHILPSPTIPPPHKSPGSINFPRLNASPTHIPKLNIPPSHPKKQRSPSPNARPRPFSPTEKNDLNMPGGAPSGPAPPSSSQLHRQQSSGSRDRLDRDHRERDRGHHRPYQILNNGQRDQYSDHHRSDPAARYLDGQYDYEPSQSRSVLGHHQGAHGQPPASNMPNGFKPGQRTVSDRITVDSSRGGSAAKARQNSDSDDDDWC